MLKDRYDLALTTAYDLVLTTASAAARDAYVQLEAKRPCLIEQKALLEMKRRPGRLFYRKRDGFGPVRHWSL